MSIRVLCERCGKSYDFKAEHIGKRFRCKSCDKVLEVKDMLSEFENIESQSSEVVSPIKRAEQQADKAEAKYNQNDDYEDEEPKEIEVTKRNKNKSGKGKKDDKDKEEWQERLQVKKNNYVSPGQAIVRMMIRNIYMVIFATIGMICAIALIVYLVII